MSIEILKEKSHQNLEVAKWAENKHYYDVAISRYYYSEYQKIIYISKKMIFYMEPPKSENSHIYTINNFASSIGHKISDEDKMKILNLKKLRKLRNDADYKEEMIDSKNYSLRFKFVFNDIQDITNKLL